MTWIRDTWLITMVIVVVPDISIGQRRSHPFQMAFHSLTPWLINGGPIRSPLTSVRPGMILQVDWSHRLITSSAEKYVFFGAIRKTWK